jgi:uncharacterized protein
MKIAVVGGTGKAGSRVVKEALARGHQVTAVARHVEGVAREPNLSATLGDASDPQALAKILAGHDVVVSSLRFMGSDPAKLIDAVKKSGVKATWSSGGPAALRSRPAKRSSIRQNFRRSLAAKQGRGANSSTPCAASASLTGRFFRRRRCLLQASAPASSVSARISC